MVLGLNRGGNLEIGMQAYSFDKSLPPPEKNETLSGFQC